MSKSKNEELKAVYRGVEKLKHGIFSEMRCAYIAKVIKYDPKKHLADIQPLANTSDGQESAQYLDVPVAESCYILDEIMDRLKPQFETVDKYEADGTSMGTQFSSKFPKKHLMRKGVPVIAVTLDRDNDNWEGGNSVNTYMPNTSRLHDGNDAIVVAVLGGDAVNG